MKCTLFIILIFLFTACTQKQNKQEFECADLQYSAYLLHFNGDNNKWEFYLANYMHMDSSGQFNLIRHDAFMDTTQYLTGILDDPTRKIIDSVLLENNYFPAITANVISDTPIIIYDGFTYLLDYKLKGKDRVKIQYINSPSRSPQNMRFLTAILDKEIAAARLKKIAPFYIKQYTDTLIKISSSGLPPVPVGAPPLQKIKFIPPGKN